MSWIKPQPTKILEPSTIFNSLDSTQLALRFLAHFVVRVALDDEAARALSVGDLGHEGRRIADTGRNFSRSARRQTLLQRQFHGAVNWDVHHAIVLIGPAVTTQRRELLSAVRVQVGTRVGLQSRLRRQHPRVFEWRRGPAQALHLSIKKEQPPHGDKDDNHDNKKSQGPLEQAARVRVTVLVALVWRAVRVLPGPVF